MSDQRLISVDLDETGLPAPTPEIAQERRVAIFDLLEDNHFALPAKDGDNPASGPFRLHLGIVDGRLAFEVGSKDRERIVEFHLSLSPFRRVIRDYFGICEAYFDAVKHLPPAQIEAIDMGRRGIHNEGSTLLMERLDGKIETDMVTARRLFTLICVLHFKG
jgi:uncharacterized protein (UPF0262 family)